MLELFASELVAPCCEDRVLLTLRFSTTDDLKMLLLDAIEPLTEARVTIISDDASLQGCILKEYTILFQYLLDVSSVSLVANMMFPDEKIRSLSLSSSRFKLN